MKEITERFLQQFTQEDVIVIADELTQLTQQKFKADLSDAAVDKLMLELKAVQSLRYLLQGWINERLINDSYTDTV